MPDLDMAARVVFPALMPIPKPGRLRARKESRENHSCCKVQKSKLQFNMFIVFIGPMCMPYLDVSVCAEKWRLSPLVCQTIVAQGSRIHALEGKAHNGCKGKKGETRCELV